MGSELQQGHVNPKEGGRGGTGEAELVGFLKEETGDSERPTTTAREEELGIGEDGNGGAGGRQEGEEDEVLVVKLDDVSSQKDLPLRPPPPPPPPVLTASFAKQQQQQRTPPPGPLVHWERFLPVQSLKVLLVENDDSTRQVVSALLRNCSYEVTATENGLEAWKILEDLTNHIDLVLTEVVMPCLSGVGLLCKIMNHKTLKNIPVIMMSSHDSMGIVFKCLANGAVDFLVKPIRKNELRNLWQHVWRRCHSSSGSGSESGIQTQSNNNTGSYNDDNDDDDTSTDLNIEVGSDNGSGIQNSWTKRAAELESPHPLSPMVQLANPPNSTCAQVIHSKTETFPKDGNKDDRENEILEDESIGTDLKIGKQRDPKLLIGHCPNENDKKVRLNTRMPSKQRISENEENAQPFNELLELDVGKLATEPSNKVDCVGAGDSSHSQTLPKGAFNVAHMISEGKDMTSAEDIPSLDLSLKRSNSSRDGRTGITDHRSVLRHSDLSAFSRYNTSAASNQIPSGCGDFSFPVENNTGGLKVECISHPIPMSNVIRTNQVSKESCHNNDMRCTSNNSFAEPITQVEKSEVEPTANGSHSSAFHPVRHQSSATKIIEEKINNLTGSPTIVLARDICLVQAQEPQHYHQHYHQVCNMQQQQSQSHDASDHDDVSLKILSSTVPQCGSSNLFSGPVECNAANYSVNVSASASNHGSNAHNGSSIAVNTRGLNVDSDHGLTAKSGSGGDGSGSGSRAGENRFAQREAALHKFRQKRKERCFEKKVRYQSRKKLAEQRPRMRGQFVRQAVREQKDRDSHR